MANTRLPNGKEFGGELAPENADPTVWARLRQLMSKTMERIGEAAGRLPGVGKVMTYTTVAATSVLHAADGNAQETTGKQEKDEENKIVLVSSNKSAMTGAKKAAATTEANNETNRSNNNALPAALEAEYLDDLVGAENGNKHLRAYAAANVEMLRRFMNDKRNFQSAAAALQAQFILHQQYRLKQAESKMTRLQQLKKEHPNNAKVDAAIEKVQAEIDAIKEEQGEMRESGALPALVLESDYRDPDMTVDSNGFIHPLGEGDKEQRVLTAYVYTMTDSGPQVVCTVVGGAEDDKTNRSVVRGTPAGMPRSPEFVTDAVRQRIAQRKQEQAELAGVDRNENEEE